jgi:hypothetical protein
MTASPASPAPETPPHDDDEELLYNSVYCSRASAGVGDADVQRIVAASHRNNPARGITGLLVFGSGIFFQWLEGPREHVQQLMQILHADTRHQDVLLLEAEEELRERLFPAWDMEHVDADAIRDVLLDARDNASDERHVATLDRLLQHLDTGALRALGAPAAPSAAQPG